jgi:hypothetical protein
MRANAKRIVKQVKTNLDENRSGRVNLYLNLKTYKSFKAACERQGLPASPVIEELMREFIKSLNKKS